MHSHYRVAQQPGHQIKPQHVKKPGDIKRNQSRQQKARSDWGKKTEQRIGGAYKETHEEKGRIFRKKKTHSRSSDQCPHHYPGDIIQGNDPKRKNFRHRVHRYNFIKELKNFPGQEPREKTSLVYRISELPPERFHPSEF